MKYENDQERKLRQFIKSELDTCKGVETPYICKAISTNGGYRRIEQLVIGLVMADNQTTVKDAILHIETEYGK
jgi:hypothetical protein